MRGILADNDVEGILAAIVPIWLSDVWSDLWSAMGCTVETFASLDLPRDATDAIVWTTCQDRHIALITGNRNAVGPDSLEATIRRSNRPESLPVFTISNPRRVLRDRAYAQAVAERLLDHLMNIERVRGTGRIYVP